MIGALAFALAVAPPPNPPLVVVSWPGLAESEHVWLLRDLNALSDGRFLAVAHDQGPNTLDVLRLNLKAVVLVGPTDLDGWAARRDRYVPELKRTAQALAKGTSVILATPPSADPLVRREVAPLVRQAARELGFPLADLGALNLPESDPESRWTMAITLADSLEDGKARKANWRVVESSSEEPGEGPAAAAVDGDPDTYWHSAWASREPKHPHSLVVDLGKPARLEGVRLLPRRNGVNGRIKGCEVWVGLSRQALRRVFVGECAAGSGWSVLRFAGPENVRFIRLVATSEVNGGPWASLGELDLLPARPAD